MCADGLLYSLARIRRSPDRGLLLSTTPHGGRFLSFPQLGHLSLAARNVMGGLLTWWRLTRERHNPLGPARGNLEPMS
jgi:hypothetical protein